MSSRASVRVPPASGPTLGKNDEETLEGETKEVAVKKLVIAW